jgi:hypothetical protein
MQETRTAKETRLRAEYAATYARLDDAEVLRILSMQKGRTFTAQETGRRRAAEMIAAEATRRGLR